MNKKMFDREITSMTLRAYSNRILFRLILNPECANAHVNAQAIYLILVQCNKNVLLISFKYLLNNWSNIVCPSFWKVRYIWRSPCPSVRAFVRLYVRTVVRLFFPYYLIRCISTLMKLPPNIKKVFISRAR